MAIRVQAVLNAFRHHRGRHVKPQTATTASTGAQRLSASQRSALASSAPTPTRISCAQRLSASQRSARSRRARRQRRTDVLNAFRHHRGRHAHAGRGNWIVDVCSTPFGITEVGTVRCLADAFEVCVLNAFRHHRGRHDGNQPRGLGGARVLNAFRHHRGRHHREEQKDDRNQYVLNAFRHHRGRHRERSARFAVARNCAQRLSASQRSALGRSHGVGDGQGLCSTPFGITEVGTRSRTMACRQPGSAQRLSASQRSAQGNLLRPQRGIRVLNAFRHHRGRHTDPQRKAIYKVFVLNAFRHHRGRHVVPSSDTACVVSAQRLSASQRSARVQDLA